MSKESRIDFDLDPQMEGEGEGSKRHPIPDAGDWPRSSRCCVSCFGLRFRLPQFRGNQNRTKMMESASVSFCFFLESLRLTRRAL